MPLLDDVQRVWRDFVRYTGDGLPNPPVGHPLSSGGDPRSGKNNPSKGEIRDLLIAMLQASGDPSALQAILTQLDGKAGLTDLGAEVSRATSAEAALRANSGKLFATRQAAVDFGQGALPDSLRVIATREGSHMVYRGYNQTADDPLFPTYPNWGVLMRLPGVGLLDAEALARETADAGLGDSIDAEALAREAEVATITARLTIGGDLGDVVPVVDTETGGAVIGVDVARGEVILRLSPDVVQSEVPVRTLRLEGNIALGDDEEVISDRYGNSIGVIRNGRLVVPQPGKSDGVSYDALPLRTSGGLGDDDVLVLGDDERPLLTNRNGRLVAEIEPYIPSVPDVGHDAWGWTWRNGEWGFTGNLWGDGPRGYRTDGSRIWADSNRANIVLFVGSDLRECGRGDVPYHAFGPNYAPISDGQCAAFCEAEALWRIAQRQSPPVNMVVERYSATLGDLLSSGYQTGLALQTDTARREGAALGYAPTASYAVLSHSFDTGADYTARFEQLVAKLEHQYGVGRVIWTQFAGTKTIGTIPEILHQEAVTAGVCATPLYPFEVEPLTGVNLTGDAARLVAEHEALAAITVDWRLPRLITAMLEGSTIRVKFDCAEGIVLDEYTTMTNRGFALDGVTNGATITGVSIGGPLPGEDVLITLSEVPTGDLVLRYAYGMPASSDQYPANRGALRANWTAPSKLVPGALLKKFAPAFQIEVV